jgi:broad specificity phosphatase PhoE
MANVPGRLLVVRHGATEWSRSGQHTGRIDVPLLPDGEAEAADVGERLAELEPALVLSSPLQRALHSCKLAGFGEAVETTELLLEMDYGDYEGVTTAQIRAERPGWDLFRDGCPDGESISDVGNRADQLLERLRADESLAGRDVLAFAHGHILRVLAARWLELPPAEARRFTLGSGRVGVLAYEHEWTVLAGWGV